MRCHELADEDPGAGQNTALYSVLASSSARNAAYLCPRAGGTETGRYRIITPD